MFREMSNIFQDLGRGVVEVLASFPVVKNAYGFSLNSHNVLAKAFAGISFHAS